MKRKFTRKELDKLHNLPTNEEIDRHIVYCPECNPAYTEIAIHAMKQRMLGFIAENDIDHRTPHYKWAKGKLK